MTFPAWFLETIRCPETGNPLRLIGDCFERPDGKKYPIIDGIPNLVFPETALGEDAKWQRFYNMFATFYDLNERFMNN